MNNSITPDIHNAADSDFPVILCDNGDMGDLTDTTAHDQNATEIGVDMPLCTELDIPEAATETEGDIVPPDAIHAEDRFSVLEITGSLAVHNLSLPIPDALREIQEGRRSVTDADAQPIAEFISEIHGRYSSMEKVHIGTVINALGLQRQGRESIIKDICNYLNGFGVKLSEKTLYKYAQTARSVLDFASCLDVQELRKYERLSFRMKTILSSLQADEDRRKAFLEVINNKLATRAAEAFVKALKHPEMGVDDDTATDSQSDEEQTLTDSEIDRSPLTDEEKAVLTPRVIADDAFMVSAPGQALVEATLAAPLSIQDRACYQESLLAKKGELESRARDIQQQMDGLEEELRELRNDIEAAHSSIERYAEYLKRFKGIAKSGKDDK